MTMAASVQLCGYCGRIPIDQLDYLIDLALFGLSPDPGYNLIRKSGDNVVDRAISKLVYVEARTLL